MTFWNRKTRRLSAAGALLSAAVAISGCAGEQETQASVTDQQTVRVSREDLVTVTRDRIRTGPLVSGTLTAERQATVRAEVGGAMLEVRVDEGDTVKKGQLLGRIEARELGDARRSAETMLRSAETSLELTRSEAERTERLVKGGALAERDLEVARNAVANAEAQVASARAALAASQQRLADTVVRAPIDGVVSDRAASPGDVVTPGAALFTILDPSSLQLEASVPSDQVRAIRKDAPVEFTVHGYPGQQFTGRIDRISPAADPLTRQVSIFVSLPNTTGQLLAGLYAEGRINSESREALVVPASAVDASTNEPTVMRIRDGKVERVVVGLGLRDNQGERVEVVSGLQEGDLLLTGTAQAITPGTPVSVQSGTPSE